MALEDPDDVEPIKDDSIISEEQQIPQEQKKKRTLEDNYTDPHVDQDKTEADDGTADGGELGGELKGYSGIKTTLFTDPNTHEKHPIPVSMSPMPTVKRILTYVERTGFCGILCIGMSGTGKSTLAKYLVHQIHMRKNFVVHWYERDDIQKMDKIIKNLQRGTPAIIVFDDASFSLDQLKKEQINKIAQQLTYVRHDVRAPVIIIMNIHYSKAISRFFRNVPFAFLTSISQEEVHTFQDVWPHGRWKFKDFAWYYQQMMFNNQWTFEIDRWNKRTYTYRTDKPFRLGLALEGNMIHFFVYLKDGCMICDTDYDIKKVANSKDLVDHFIKGYGVARARSMLKLYAFARHGLKVIDSNRYAIWKSISNYDTNNRINWNNVVAELDKTQKKRRRTYIKKDKMDRDQELLDQIEHTEDAQQTQEQDFKAELEEQFEEAQKKRSLQDIAKDETAESLQGATYQENEDAGDMSYGYPEPEGKQDNQDSSEENEEKQ